MLSPEVCLWCKLGLGPHRRLLAKVSQELSFFDWLRFCEFINKTSSRKREQLALKKENMFKWPNTSQNGDPQLQHENIFSQHRTDEG